jgi:putative nucleotidyltransferase with HDIG domain
MRQEVALLLERISRHHPDTMRHLNSVRDLTYMLAKRVGYNAAHADAIAHAGLLHDVGKLWVPTDILDAPRKLNDSEMTVIKGHPLSGAMMALQIGEEPVFADWIVAHHERLDGTGYPYGRTDPPPEAMIIAVTDIWDATGSLRPYRSGYTERAKRIAIIQEERERLGADLVDAFIELLGEPNGIPDHPRITSVSVA